MDIKVRRAIATLEANSHHRFSLSELARSVNLSPFYFCHLFKTQTGISPGRYLINLRMQQACHLLETTQLSVKEVMAQVGFNDKSHFTREFKRCYGQSPSQYRKHRLE